MIVLRLGWVCVQHFFDLDKYLYIYMCVWHRFNTCVCKQHVLLVMFSYNQVY